MTPALDPGIDFEFDAAAHAAMAAGAALIVDFDGFEGPLDLLLDLARRQKLDLRTLPILVLADQYLAFIDAAHNLRLELAGDYLVMAAWLTYLKSRLLLPAKAESDQPAAEDLVQDLAERLRRLEAIREAAEALRLRHAEMALSFPRGACEPTISERRRAWDVSVEELVAAYAERRVMARRANYAIAERRTLSIPDARALLERLIGQAAEWCPITLLLRASQPHAAEPRSMLASSLVAALELAREGRLELRQESAFAPLLLRRSPAASAR